MIDDVCLAGAMQLPWGNHSGRTANIRGIDFGGEPSTLTPISLGAGRAGVRSAEI
jgi:hypothetical protein